jgi:hypothetical protein
LQKSKIGKARFWVRGLVISPPIFYFWERAFPLEFSEKKLAGTLGLDPLPRDRQYIYMQPRGDYIFQKPMMHITNPQLGGIELNE